MVVWSGTDLGVDTDGTWNTRLCLTIHRRTTSPVHFPSSPVPLHLPIHPRTHHSLLFLDICYLHFTARSLELGPSLCNPANPAIASH